MYCPKCATHLADTATRCQECGLDVQPIAQMLRQEVSTVARPSARTAAERAQRWKHQRRSWGTLLVMCSLLVGCLIPICAGLFSEFDILSSIITVLAGLAGLLLIGGSMLLMAADGVILVGNDVTPSPGDNDASLAGRSPQPGQTTQLVFEDTKVSAARHDDPAPYPVSR